MINQTRGHAMLCVFVMFEPFVQHTARSFEPMLSKCGWGMSEDYAWGGPACMAGNDSACTSVSAACISGLGVCGGYVRLDNI
jgi:hypothetical protein